MAKKLTGLLNLSKIPKELIGQTKNGAKCIYVDIVPNRNGADNYGNTHAITLYNKNTKQTIYLAGAEAYLSRYEIDCKDFIKRLDPDYGKER